MIAPGFDHVARVMVNFGVSAEDMVRAMRSLVRPTKKAAESMEDFGIAYKRVSEPQEDLLSPDLGVTPPTMPTPPEVRQ